MSQAGTFRIGAAGAAILTITGNDGIPVAPDAGGNIDALGAHGINSSNTAANTITFALDNTITLGDLAAVPAGSPSLTLTTGDLLISAGNINLPTTSSANAGVIEVNNTRFVHSFGGTNTFVGASSGNFTLTGFSSVGIGSNSLTNITSGAFNFAGGFLSQNAATSGSNNVSVGAASLAAATGASSTNVAIGSSALNLATTPNNVIAVGYLAGTNYTTNESNNILIGNQGTIADSGVIRVGTNATHTSTFVAGINGVNVGNVASVVSINGDQLGSTVITAGSGITVTPGANTITIAATGASGTSSFSAYTSAVGAASNVTGDGTLYGPVIFDSEVFDNGGNYDNVTGIYTAPSDGVYYFACSVQTEGYTAAHTIANIRINYAAAPIRMITNQINPSVAQQSTGQYTYHDSAIVPLVAGEQVSVSLFVDGGALSVDIIASTGQNQFTWFCGTRIG